MAKCASLGAATAVAAALMSLSACGSNGASAAAGGQKLHTISQIKPAPTRTPSRTKMHHTSPRAAVSSARARSSAGHSSANSAILHELATQAEGYVKRTVGNFGGVYTKVDVVPAPPSGLKFVYVLSHYVDPSTAAVSIERSLPTMRTAFRTLVAPDMESAGIAHPQVTYSYFNPDNSPVWSRTFRIN